MTRKDKPESLDDAAMDAAQGGAETVHLYLQSAGEKIDGESTARAGLRSDGELVQAVSDPVSKDMVLKGKKILQN